MGIPWAADSLERRVGAGLGAVVGFIWGALIAPKLANYMFEVTVFAGPIGGAITGWLFGPELRNPIRAHWKTGLLFGLLEWPVTLLAVAVVTTIEVGLGGADLLELLPRFLIGMVVAVVLGVAVPVGWLVTGPLGLIWVQLAIRLLPPEPEVPFPQLGASSRR